MIKPPLRALATLICLALAPQAHADPAQALCATNPAFSEKVMLTVIAVQLEQDHDPSLDAQPPEKLAEQAAAQGIAECAADIHQDPSIASVLGALKGADLSAGWDAYNTTCSPLKANKGACINAEVQSARVIKRMTAKDDPKGSKSLAQACQLLMVSDPGMVEWRECVDMGLSAHPTKDAVKSCKLSLAWHSASTGIKAGEMLTSCLKGH